MTGNLDDFVGAAGEPDVAVVIDLGRVSAVVDIANDLPVVASIALWLTPRAREGGNNLRAGWILQSGGNSRQ